MAVATPASVPAAAPISALAATTAVAAITAAATTTSIVVVVIVAPSIPLGDLLTLLRVVAVALGVIDPMVVIVGKNREGDGTEHYD